MITHLGARLADGFHGDEMGLKQPGYQPFVIRDSIDKVHQVSFVVFPGLHQLLHTKWTRFSWTGSGRSRRLLMADDGMMATDNISIRRAVLCKF